MYNVIKYLILLIVSVNSQREKPPTENSSKDAVIRKYDFHLGDSGDFNFAFESSDGTTREETATVEKSEKEENLIVRGSYSFIDDTGKKHTVNYIADKDGYRILEDNVPVQDPGSQEPRPGITRQGANFPLGSRQGNLERQY